MTRSNSRFSRMRSRPQSQANIQGIDEAEEFANSEEAVAESSHELNKAKLDIHNEVYK